MEFKYLVFVLIISALQGEDVVSLKTDSSSAQTKSFSLDTIKNSDVGSTILEPISPELHNNNNTSSTGKVTNPKSDTFKERVNAVEKHIISDAIKTTKISDTTVITTQITDATTERGVTITTPILGPEEGKWIVKNETGDICIVAQMELQFNVTYPGLNNSMENATIFVPKNSSASGICSNSSQSLQLTWLDGNSFTILFGINKTSNKFRIELFNLKINASLLKNINSKIIYMKYLSNKSDLPDVPVKMSYKCDKEQMLMLNSSANVYSAKMLIRHTQLEAFMHKNSTSFSEAKDCEGFETPDIVPVAVGCVLSILVVIVLVAYLIGRRRSQSRGYLSM